MSTPQPLSDRVVIQPLEQNTSFGSNGLVTPDSSKEHNNKGIVLAVGPGKLLQDGTRGPMQVKKDDIVHYNEAATFPVTKDGNDYHVVPEDHIHAID